MEDEYEVFKGVPQAKPFRLGLVRGYERATQLMYRMYARLPGDYFVRCASTDEVVASVQRHATGIDATQEPNFDIFRGLPDKNAVWVETVEGLSDARDRMEQIAQSQPGRYFVFSRLDHAILSRVEVSHPAESARESGSAA